MAYETYQDYLTAHNSTGLEGMFQYAASTVNLFIPLLLFAVFIIALLGTYFSSKRMNGRGDFWSSMVAASFMTSVLSVLLSLVPALINPGVIVICISIFVVSVTILFVTRE
jgi:uncharacterized membrane protein YiaA